MEYIIALIISIIVAFFCLLNHQNEQDQRLREIELQDRIDNQSKIIGDLSAKNNNLETKLKEKELIYQEEKNKLKEMCELYKNKWITDSAKYKKDYDELLDRYIELKKITSKSR